MRLPVCVADLEAGALCSSCQDKLNRGRITQFDVDFSKWLLARQEKFYADEDFTLLRALNIADRLILIVKRKSRDILFSAHELVEEMQKTYGQVLVLERPASLRKLVRDLIYPAIETGVNSLYLPDGSKESIVILRSEDRPRIPYSAEDLRQIVSAVTEESVLFQYQEEAIRGRQLNTSDVFEEKLRDFTQRQPRR